MNIKYGLALLISAASNAAPLTAHTPAVAPGPAAQSEACTGQPVLGREYLGSGKPIPAGSYVFTLRRAARFDVQLVGGGGAGGLVAWNWRAPPSLSDGHPGNDTRLVRCSSGAVLALAEGGSAGKGDSAHTSDNSGMRGEDFNDDVTHPAFGHGGAGGFGVPAESGRRGGDGSDASGFGAGGGGQGKTDLQINGPGKSHGGKGVPGVAKFIRIGR